MAMLKTARAQVFTPQLTLDKWDALLQIQNPAGASLSHQIRRAAREPKNFLAQFDPNRFLLTHATIVSSVDVEDAPQVRLSSDPFQPDASEGESPIIRPWSDYLIKPECSQFVNQNGDAWERKLLMSTYKTFCGAENYLEHVQVPSLSKGKILDAVARVMEDTVYIDILVATDRCHTELVSDILDKVITAMSMGCTIQFSICSRCGNMAYDEPQLCSHVKYNKRLPFQSQDRKQRIVAELCGHHSDPTSVKFIEASWVKQPAFEGAVARNILNPDFPEGGKHLEALLQEAHRIQPWQTPSLSGMDEFLRTASKLIEQNGALQAALAKRAFSFDDDDEDGGGEGGEDAPKETPAQKFKRETKDVLRKELEEELRQELVQESRTPEPPMDPMPEAESKPHESIIQSSKKADRTRIAKAVLQAEVGPERKLVYKAMVALQERPQAFKKAWKRSASGKSKCALVLAMRLHDQMSHPSQQAPPLSTYVRLAKASADSDPWAAWTKLGGSTNPKVQPWVRKRLAFFS
jgi:hypothetical protein